MLDMHTPRILIVDDAIENAQLLKQMLRKEAYELICVHDGQTALNRIRDEWFDLVLLDVMLPDISGLSVLEKIREQFTVTDLPVILISALSDIRDVEIGLKMLANDYITKPIQRDIVRARVTAQLTVKRLSDERQALVEKLERINTLHVRLMRIASHDLKNPLHNINMVHTMLEEYVGDDEYAHEMLDMAQRSVKTMTGIVQEFLDLDIVRGDDIEINLQPVNVAHVISEVLLENIGAAEYKQIQFDIHFSDVMVNADSRRLHQVLSNLVSNAIKYSPSHSVVNIRTEFTHDSLFIHIVDRGVGIPLQEHNKLFQAFADISTEPTGGEHSSGVGLWIARQMMLAQNGDIGLQTPPDGGSDFWVQIPLAHDPQPMLVKDII